MTRDTAITIDLKPAPQPNFGNVTYMAVIDGEVVGNGSTAQDAYTDALKTLLNGYRHHHYEAAMLYTVNGVTHHKGLTNDTR